MAVMDMHIAVDKAGLAGGSLNLRFDIFVFFGVGILLAGPSAARHVRHVAMRWLKKRWPAKDETTDHSQPS